MRFFLMAALIGALAPLCAQSSLVTVVNAPLTGQGQSRALLYEVVVGASPATISLDVQISTTHADGMAVVLYSPGDEYNYPHWSPFPYSHVVGATDHTGQGSFSHTLPSGAGTQRFVLECFPKAPSTALVADCTLDVQVSAGTIAMVSQKTGTRLEGYRAHGLGVLVMRNLNSTQVTDEWTVHTSTGTEQFALHLSAENASMTLYDVTGATPVFLGGYNYSGSSAGQGTSVRQLPAGTTKLRLVSHGTGTPSAMQVELRLTGGAIMDVPAAPAPAPIPNPGFNGGFGGGGGGGCAAGIGATATIPLVAMLAVALRRRRAA